MKYFSSLVLFSCIAWLVCAANSPRFRIVLNGRQHVTPEEKISVQIYATSSDRTGAEIASARYRILLKFDNKLVVMSDKQLKVAQGRHVMSAKVKVPENVKGARKVSVCIYDSRASSWEKMIGSHIKGCSKQVRIVPQYCLNSGLDEIEMGPESSVCIIDSNNLVFQRIPEYLKSNVQYSLPVNVVSKVPFVPALLEIYLKSDKSKRLNVPAQIMSAQQTEYGNFQVTFSTPQLDSKARKYSICVRVKGYGKFQGRERGCSELIEVGEAGYLVAPHAEDERGDDDSSSSSSSNSGGPEEEIVEEEHEVEEDAAAEVVNEIQEPEVTTETTVPPPPKSRSLFGWN